MSLFSRLYRGETSYDFVGARRTFLIISSVLLVVSALSLAIRGLNLSLDFRGGVAVETENPAGAGVGDVRDALASLGLSDARIQLLADGQALRVQTEALAADQADQFVRAVAAVAGTDVIETSVDEVGPTFGAQIAERAVLALFVFLGAVILFMSWRLEWKMALSGIVALFHDLVITFGVYSITGFEVTPATVIAVLTILGYSLYDTVVVFDKVKENVEASDRVTFTDIVNRSMNQVLMRSVNTSLTSLLPVGSLLFVGSFLLGARTLLEFALALFVGIAAGTYSSIAVASPLLAIWKEREEEWTRIRRRQGRISEDQTVPVSRTKPTADVTRPRAATGATPRPPKKRRR
jgi:preprotein translocase subunit SecF